MAIIRAIFFDLDGTLVDGSVTWRRSVSETIRAVTERNVGVDLGELESAYYAVAAQVWDTVKDGSPPSWGSMEAESVVRQVWGRALGCLGVVDEEIVRQAAEAYYAALRNMGAPAYGDVVECLQHLRAGYALGVITNGPATTQLPKIELAGLAPYFNSVTTTDIGSGKPHGRIFEHALASVVVEAAHAVYVGDSLDWDVCGANNAGMVSVWLNRTGAAWASGDPVPDAEIVSLRALPELVAGMRGAGSRLGPAN